MEIILGHNKFFGINHKAENIQRNQKYSSKKISNLLKFSAQVGYDGFMVSTHPLAKNKYGKYLANDKTLFNKKKHIHLLVPYAYKINQELNKFGPTKLFFNKRDRNDAFKAIDDVVALTGNQRQKAYRYKYNYKKTNLPVGVLGHIEANGVLNTLKNTLYPMRMPDLGIDLNKIYNPKVAEDLAKIPLTTIMQQIRKLLTQVDIFVKNRKIHGDIREYNIMIDTKTGELTIIDFDFFTNDVEFFRGKNTIKYQRPPENYLYCLTLKRRDYFPDANILLQQAKQESNKDFISSLGILDKDYKQLGIYLSDNNEFLFRKELDLTFKTYDDAFKILKKNYVEILEGVDIVNDEARTLYENSMLPTFDGFGLASSLLDLLVVMYTKYAFDPKYSMEEAISHMKTHLKKKVVHAAAAAGGAGVIAPMANISYEEYNNDELVQIYKTVQCLFYMVLMPMITLNIGDRTRPEVALGHIDKIILIHDKPEYLNKFHAITVSNMNLFRNASIGKNAPADAFVSQVSQPVKVLKSNSLPALPASNNIKGSKGGKRKAPNKFTKKRKVKKNKTYKKKSRK